MSKRMRMTWAFGLVLLVAGAAGATVEGTPRLVVEMTAERLVVTQDESGEETVRRVAPTMLLPGEEVIYTLTYRNSHPDVANDIAITNPIDPSLRYQHGTATGEDTAVEFSVDGGTTFAPAGELRVVDADGDTRPAIPDDYTHIRWIRLRPLDPGNEGRVTFAARVR